MAANALDALKRECRTLEMYVDQRLQSRPAPNNKPSTADLEAGGSALDPEAPRLREIDDAITKLSQTVDRLAEAAASSGIRTNVAMSLRYKDVVAEFRQEYRRQLAALRARRDNELLYADVHGKRSGAAETSATDLILRERGSLLSGSTTVEELLAQAARTRDALASQRSTIGSAAGRLGHMIGRVPGVNMLMRSISRRRMRNDVVVGLTIAACVCFTLWWTVLPHER